MATLSSTDKDVQVQSSDGPDAEAVIADTSDRASLNDTIPPTPRHDLLVEEGASLYFLSADAALISAIDTAVGDDYPVVALAEWVELVELLEDGKGRIILLDADHAKANVRKRITQLGQLADDLVILVATSRESAGDLVPFMADRSVHRVLIKPAEPAVIRLLLESAVVRYMGLRDESGRQSAGQEQDSESAGPEAAEPANPVTSADASMADTVAGDSADAGHAGAATQQPAAAEADLVEVTDDAAADEDASADEVPPLPANDDDAGTSRDSADASLQDALRERIRERTAGMRSIGPLRGVTLAVTVAVLLVLFATLAVWLGPLGDRSEQVQSDTGVVPALTPAEDVAGDRQSEQAIETEPIAGIPAEVLRQTGGISEDGSGLPPVENEENEGNGIVGRDAALQASTADSLSTERANPDGAGSATSATPEETAILTDSESAPPSQVASNIPVAETQPPPADEPSPVEFQLAVTDANADASGAPADGGPDAAFAAGPAVAGGVTAGPIDSPLGDLQSPGSTDADAAVATAASELDNYLALARERLAAGLLYLPIGDSAADYLMMAATFDPAGSDVAALRREIVTAIAAEARTALDRGDLDAVSGMLDQAAMLDAESEVLVALRADLARALDARSAREQGAIFAIAEQRFAEGRLFEPADDNALIQIRRLATLNPEYDGLASLRASVVAGIADRVTGSIAAGSWEDADAALSALVEAGAAPDRVALLRDELSAGRLQQTFLRVPAEPGELILRSAGPAAYPPAAQRRNIEGWVDVEFVVNSDGEPTAIRVVAAEPESWFEMAAIEAVEAYRFEPFERDGRVYERLARLRVRFGLE